MDETHWRARRERGLNTMGARRFSDMVIPSPAGAGRMVTIRRNSASSNTQNYAIPSPGNQAFGPIVDAFLGGDLAAIPGAEHPQANFEF